MSDATHRRTPAPRPHDPGGSDDADPAWQLWCLWQQGHQPRVADFLEQAGVRDPDRIVMALRVDQSERCRLGQWVPAEDYLEVFPAIRDRVESTIDLIFAEFLLREERGEPFRIARALSLEACYVAYEGGSRKRRFREMMRMIEALAQEIDEPYIWAGVSLSQAVEAYATGRWKLASEASDRAVDILRTRCTFELDSGSLFSLWCLQFRGEIAELGRRWPVVLKEASGRDDRHMMTNLNTSLMSTLRLAAACISSHRSFREGILSGRGRELRDRVSPRRSGRSWRTRRAPARCCSRCSGRR